MGQSHGGYDGFRQVWLVAASIEIQPTQSGTTNTKRNNQHKAEHDAALTFLNPIKGGLQLQVGLRGSHLSSVTTCQVEGMGEGDRRAPFHTGQATLSFFSTVC